ncbi:MAG: OmpA family protein, partial [Cetobacterium sp.]
RRPTAGGALVAAAPSSSASTPVTPPAPTASSTPVSDKPATFGARRPTAGGAPVAAAPSSSVSTPVTPPAPPASSTPVSDKPATFGARRLTAGGAPESAAPSSSPTFSASAPSTSAPVATASSSAASPSSFSAPRSSSRVESTKPAAPTSSVKQIDVDFPPIYFQYNSPYVDKKSFYNVAKLIQFLKKNPDVTVHLDAFSDARGSQEVKVKISERRARVLRQYLKDNGIDVRRVTADAHGDVMLVNKCVDGVDCPPSEHARNRRVEVSFKESSK